MPAILAWLDFDSAERERTQRILALFRVKEARDELGLGGIRDSIADQLFPGTSTIQTRLRYTLFVPWMYRLLEERHIPSHDISAKARKFELELVKPLLENDDRAGVFGRLAGGGLKRLPSSVYWAGLGSWGIRRFQGSLDEYHRALDAVYKRRGRQKADGDEPGPDPLGVTWDPKLVDSPPDFPSNLTFELSREEAGYLQDRIAVFQNASLIGFLAVNGKPALAEFPWEHPQIASFRPEHLELLDNARLFSEVMYGAALVYNILLSELREKEEWVSEHRDLLARWESGLPRADIQRWDLPRFWQLVRGHGYRIGSPTQNFVERWVGYVISDTQKLAERQDIRDLIRSRERILKGAKSRFISPRALDQWGGSSGLSRLSFRWRVTNQLLNDLYSGLRAEKVVHA